MIFDTHAHIDDEAFDPDREEMLSSFAAAGIDTVVNATANITESEAAVALSKRFPFIYATAGVHPCDCLDMTEADLQKIGDLYSQNKKTVAIGEIGLDYHWEDVPHDIQKKWFIRQLDLACELKAPVQIHSREAASDTFEILKKYEGRITGDMHCYSYSPEQARQYAAMGWRFGIGGVVTFKNARKLTDTVKILPRECILLETDSPYLAPEPLRGTRNDPRNLKHVVKKIAELRGETEEEVERYTYENALQFFQIS